MLQRGAAISAPCTLPELFRDIDLVHFVNNQGALASLVSGTSKARDIGALACVWQIVTCARQIRPWGEYVESDANCSDGLSRESAAWRFQALCAQIGATIIEAKLPIIDDLRQAPLQQLTKCFLPQWFSV